MESGNKKGKIILLWVAAFILTAATGYYQRITGPTYSKKITFTFDGTEYTYKLPRSHEETNCPVTLAVKDTSVNARLVYRRYNLNEKLTEIPFERKNDTLIAELPAQPASGKLEYAVIFEKEGKEPFQITGHEMVVIRFKGAVPGWLVIIHVIFMFAGMFLSNITGFYAFLKHPSFTRFALYTTVTLFIGGLILGPLVQKYAFGEYWTGVPFGWDLTDNKLALAFIFWLGTWLLSIKMPKYKLGIAAFIVLIIMYSIPHSYMGSEYDYKSGKVGTSKEFKL